VVMTSNIKKSVDRRGLTGVRSDLIEVVSVSMFLLCHHNFSGHDQIKESSLKKTGGVQLASAEKKVM
jgi:hypothetical protein